MTKPAAPPNRARAILAEGPLVGLKRKMPPPYPFGFLPHRYKPAIHASMLRSTCPRAYMYRERLGLTRTGEHVRAYFLGTVFHRGMEAFFRGQDPAQEVKKFLAETLLVGRGQLNGLGFLPDGTAYDSFVRTTTQDAMKGLAMVEELLQSHPLDPSQYEVVGTEVAIRAKVTHGGIPVCSIQGALDMVVRSRTTGDLWIIEYKTTASPPSQIADGLRLDCQPPMYQLLAEAKWPNDTIAGIIYLIVAKPTIQFSPQTLDRIASPGDLSDTITKKLNDGKPLTVLQKDTVEKLQALIQQDQDLYGGDPFNKYIGRVKTWYTAQRTGAREGNHACSVPAVRSTIKFQDTLPTSFVQKLRDFSTRISSPPNPALFPRCMNMYQCTGFGRSCPYLQLCLVEDNSVLLREITTRDYIQHHRDEEKTDD